VRSRSIASKAKLARRVLDVEFRTHVFMCRKAEELLSRDAVLTGKAIAISNLPKSIQFIVSCQTGNKAYQSGWSGPVISTTVSHSLK